MGIRGYGYRLKKAKNIELKASNQAWFGRYATPCTSDKLSSAKYLLAYSLGLLTKPKMYVPSTLL